MKNNNTHSFFLVVEFILLFIALPLLFFFKILPNFLMLPMLLVIFLYTFFILIKHTHPLQLQHINKIMLKNLLIRAIIVAIFLSLYTLFFKYNHLFYFVKNAPYLWLAVIIFYPFVSAFTQEIVFRKFFFFRYPSLWHHNETLTILFSAFSFSYMHIVFHNMLAVVFTLAGGLIFSFVYAKTKSITIVSIEHALYGDILFTLGLGRYFHHGSI